MNNLYQVIYYGDSQVEVGKPFAISCIISIADPVEWHKDGEPLRKHGNIRHGKDEHSYIESEMGIAGNRDKIEATISVQRALPKHQGRYQCNSLYKNYHMLYVHRNASDEKMPGSGHRGPPESILDKLDEPIVGPLLLTSMRPPLITSIAELHHPLSTPESEPLEPLETHHHHHRVDKTEKVTSHKPESGHRTKDEGQQLGSKINNHIKAPDSEHSTPDSDKDNSIVIPDETREEGPSGDGGIEEAPPPPPLFEDNAAPPTIDEDDADEDEEDSIVIESKDVSFEDASIDKLILNKSEINGIIRVDESVEEQPPPPLHQHQQHRTPSSNGLGKQLDRIRDSSNSQNNMLIAAAVIPTSSSSSTTALITIPLTNATTTTSTTSTTTTTTTSLPSKQHLETHGGGHHHHHHHEHQQQQQQQQRSTVAPGEDRKSSSVPFLPTIRSVYFL